MSSEHMMAREAKVQIEKIAQASNRSAPGQDPPQQSAAMCANFQSASGVEPSKAQAEQDEFYQPPLLKPIQGRPKNKKRLIVVLWDQTHDEGDRIALPPDELFKKTLHPNVVLFRLQWAGDAHFELHDLWKKFRGIGWFIVPADPSGTSSYGWGTPPIFTKTIHFLSLYKRGTVPAPAIAPGQLVDGGFPAVLRLVKSMWPKRRRILISSLDQAPPGWELYNPALAPPVSPEEDPP